MRYSLTDIYYLLRTPLGRMLLWHGIFQRLWPLMWVIAFIYRVCFLRKTTIIVVIGSFGKTTTLRAVKKALGKATSRYAFANCWSYVAAAILNMRPRDMFNVLEVGIDGREQMSRYAKLVKPKMVIVTSIGSEHHRSLGSLEDTRREKSAMVTPLCKNATVFLNGDDPNVLWMKNQTKARIVTFGFSPQNDVSASLVYLTPRGMHFQLNTEAVRKAIQTRLLGRHFVYPLLAAIAVATYLGIDMETVTSRLKTLEPTPGRMQRIELQNNVVLVRDDFKSTLETIYKAFSYMAKIKARRKILVLGEVSEPPGSQGPIYRDIGEQMAGIFDNVIVVGVNHQRYSAGAARAGMSRDKIYNAGNSITAAIAIVKKHLQSGDVVMVKGRDTQRLDRVSLALMGHPVKCTIAWCDARPRRCDSCPMLGTGWKSKVVI